MRELSLFTGAGGGVLGTKLLGWTTVGYVEYEPYCQQILRQRIEDGILDAAPIFGDIRTFHSEGYAEAYQGVVDVVTAGFPCQPFSTAGKRKGADDERNMWPATLGVIREVRPRFCLLENVSALVTCGYFGTILGGLAESGYDCRWRILSAAELGAPHKRDRLWIVAYPHREGQLQQKGAQQEERRRAIDGGESMADAPGGGFPIGGRSPRETGHAHGGNKRIGWWAQDPADVPHALSDGRRRILRQTGQGQDGPYLRENADREGTGDGGDGPPREMADTDKLYDDGWGHGTSKDCGEFKDPAILRRCKSKEMGDPSGSGQPQRPGLREEESTEHGRGRTSRTSEGPVEPELGRVAYGMANRVDRLKAIGNGQVPAVAALAWQILTEDLV